MKELQNNYVQNGQIWTVMEILKTVQPAWAVVAVEGVEQAGLEGQEGSEQKEEPSPGSGRHVVGLGP